MCSRLCILDTNNHNKDWYTLVEESQHQNLTHQESDYRHIICSLIYISSRGWVGKGLAGYISFHTPSQGWGCQNMNQHTCPVLPSTTSSPLPGLPTAKWKNSYESESGKIGFPPVPTQSHAMCMQCMWCTWQSTGRPQAKLASRKVYILIILPFTVLPTLPCLCVRGNVE